MASAEPDGMRWEFTINHAWTFAYHSSNFAFDPLLLCLIRVGMSIDLVGSRVLPVARIQVDIERIST